MRNPLLPLHRSRPARHLGTVTRKKWYILSAVGLLAMGCYYLYVHWQDLGFSTFSTEPTAVNGAAPIVWTPVDRTAQGFRLQMPSGTREVQVPAYAQNGGIEQVSMLYAYPDSETSYSIAWEDNPPVEQAVAEDPVHTLNNARDGALARTQTTLVSEQSSNREGFSTRDFTGRNSDGGVFSARLILVGRRLYMLMAAFPSASARRQADVDRFFNSFQVTSTSTKQ